MLELVGSKAAARFTSLQQCFRMLDADHNGRVERHEIQHLLRMFHLPEDVADQFFSYLDTENLGSLDFQEVANVIGQFIKPGYRAQPAASRRPPPPPAPPRPSSAPKSHPAPRPQQGGAQSVDPEPLEAEMRQVAEIIGSKATAKYRSTRELFRWLHLDEANQGIVSREECLRFMELFNYPSKSGEQMYNFLLTKSRSSNQVDYASFMRFFGPYIHPQYEEILRQHEKMQPAGSSLRSTSHFAPPARQAGPRRSSCRAPARPARAASAESSTPLQVEGMAYGKDFGSPNSSKASTSVGACEGSDASSVPSSAQAARPFAPASRRVSGDGVPRGVARRVVWNGNEPKIVVTRCPQAAPKPPPRTAQPHSQSMQVPQKPAAPATRPRPHTARARLEAMLAEAQGERHGRVRRSASGNHLGCGRSDKCLASTPAASLCSSMAQHWSAIA